MTTWLELNDRLMPNGRFMVNCGGIDETPHVAVHPKSVDGAWVQNSTVRALSEAFPGRVCHFHDPCSNFFICFKSWYKLTLKSSEEFPGQVCHFHFLYIFIRFKSWYKLTLNGCIYF